MGGGLRDAHGCLSPAGVSALKAAPPGGAPHELALHVAGCARCQRKLLESATANDPLKKGRGSPRPVAPSMGRTLLLAALVMATILFFLYTLRKLAGQ
jgi:hypothetical protein